jgi:hypothetical protein
MAVLAGKGTVSQSQGVGPKTYIYAITTGTITVSDACDSITTTYFGTVAAVEGTADGNHIMVQGGPGGAEAVSGIALVATFANA